jgi:hypothetical protein
MMTNLTPSLKADLSLIFQELAQDSGGLLDIKLSRFSEWSNDRAIDLDSLCGYIADLCASRQIDYGQLRKLADNLIRSDATTSQLLQQADDLAPELLKELVLQASSASTELDNIQNEAGGNKTINWIKNHPYYSGGIGSVVGLVILKKVMKRDVVQHTDNAMNELNERIVEGANHEAEGMLTDKQVAENEKAAMASREKLKMEKEILRSEFILPNHLRITPELEADLCSQIHLEAWPEQKTQMQLEMLPTLTRKINPQTYLRAFNDAKREEFGELKSHIYNEEANLIDNAECKLEKYDREAEIKAENELSTIEDKEFQRFEGSKYGKEFFRKLGDNVRGDYIGFGQKAYDAEILQYYRLAIDKVVLDNGLLPDDGLIRLDKNIVSDFRALESPEAKYIRADTFESLFQGNYIEKHHFFEAGRDSEISSSKVLDAFNNEQGLMDKWLKKYAILSNYDKTRNWAETKLEVKVTRVQHVIEERVKAEYIKNRVTAYNTLKEYRVRVESELNDAERELKSNTLAEFKRTDMLSSFFSQKFTEALNTVEIEADALLDDGQRDAIDLLQASKRRLESNLSPSELVQQFEQAKPVPAPAPAPAPAPGRANIEVSKIEDSLTHEVDISVRNSASRAEGELLNSAGFRRNVERTIFDPAREAEDLYSDLGKIAKSGARPKSVEVTLNAKLDAELDSSLLRTLSVVPKSGLDGVASEISAKESDLLSNQKAAIDNGLYQVEGSVENDLSEDLSVAKSDIVDAIDQEVQHEESIIEGDVEREIVKADQVFTAEADAAVEAVDTKVANTVDRVE